LENEETPGAEDRGQITAPAYMSAGHLGPGLPGIYTEFLPSKCRSFTLAGSQTTGVWPGSS